MTETETGELTRERIQELLDQLAHAGDELPVHAIQEIRRHKEQMIPELIGAIQRAAKAWRPGELDSPAFFAFFLLMEFRAKEGLPAIIEAVSLPDDGPFDLFGDAIHEIFPRVLIVLGGDRCREVCVELIRNPAINSYVRWSATEALVRLVFEGQQTRAEVVALCKQLLREMIDQQDGDAAGGMISSLLDLHPWEAKEEIKEAFEQDLIDPFLIDWKHASENLIDQPIQRPHQFAEPPYIDDIVAELSSWASWSPQPKSPGIAEPALPYAPPPVVRPLKAEPRVGRNDPCPCGSGKKFKKCCLRRDPLG